MPKIGASPVMEEVQNFCQIQINVTVEKYNYGNELFFKIA